jgi:hypothetical protein
MGHVIRSLDEAVAALAEGRPLGPGAFRGTVDAAGEALVSPGGTRCAFYAAEVREAAAAGRKGALLLHERAFPPRLVVLGREARVSVQVAPDAVRAPVEVRRCPGPRGGGQGQGGEALSWERVGRPGDPCLVIGEVVPGGAPGTWAVRGRWGRPPRVVVGLDALAVERLARRLRALAAAALLLDGGAVPLDGAALRLLLPAG